MSSRGFYGTPREQSIVKAAIVSKYFWAWANVIIPAAKQRPGKIAYIDLFSGPGYYRDGTPSTPILILEKAISDPNLREMLVTLFNDKDREFCRLLEGAVAKLPGIDQLRYRPQISNYLVGHEIVRMFEQIQLVPTLFFVDPWGYKGLSLQLINSVLKNWGCECIFFFNYNRINPGLENDLVKEPMDALFGPERAAMLRARLEPMSPHERELTIVEELAQALKEMGGKYVLPFRFKDDKGKRTSHHLIFVSKHIRGYEIMKEIMAKESSGYEQGVSAFEYSPASARQPLLFELARPLDALADMLLEGFAGRRLTMRQIYECHNVDRPYILKNYKEVLTQLEAAGKIVTEPPMTNRRKNTFGDNVVVTFPARRS